MIRKLFAAVVLAGLFAGHSVAALAAPAICGLRVAMVKSLQDRHNEQPVSVGLDAQGAIVEVFAAPAGNWTILQTQPSGVSCLLASGQAWQGPPVANAASRAGS